MEQLLGDTKQEKRENAELQFSGELQQSLQDANLQFSEKLKRSLERPNTNLINAATPLYRRNFMRDFIGRLYQDCSQYISEEEEKKT